MSTPIHTALIPATSTPAQPPSVPDPKSDTQNPKGAAVAPGDKTSTHAESEKGPDDLEKRLAAERSRISAARQAKAKQRDFDLKLKQANEVLARWQQIKQDPLEAMKELGYDYDKLTELKMSQGTPEAKFKTVEQQMAEMRKDYEDKIQAIRAEKQSDQQLQEQEIISNWKASVNTFVAEHPEDYQLIPKFKSEDLVAETAEEFFKTNGRVITNKEAADLVEQYLEEQVLDAAKTKRIQSKLGIKEEAKLPARPNGATQATITNDSIGHANVSGLSPASESDRLRRALAALG